MYDSRKFSPNLPITLAGGWISNSRSHCFYFKVLSACSYYVQGRKPQRNMHPRALEKGFATFRTKGNAVSDGQKTECKAGDKSSPSTRPNPPTLGDHG